VRKVGLEANVDETNDREELVPPVVTVVDKEILKIL
jgi:hypothetical protein